MLLSNVYILLLTSPLLNGLSLFHKMESPINTVSVLNTPSIKPCCIYMVVDFYPAAFSVVPFFPASFFPVIIPVIHFRFETSTLTFFLLFTFPLVT